MKSIKAMMFESPQITIHDNWFLSFLTQQVLAWIVLPVAGFFIVFPFVFIAPEMANVVEFFSPSLCFLGGYFMQHARPVAQRAGKWVWVIPSIFPIWTFCNWAKDVPLADACRYAFWPSARDDGRGVEGAFEMFFLICSLCYVAGILIAVKRCSRKLTRPVR